MKKRWSASNIILFCARKKENLSNQTIVWSKIDLTSVYLKCSDKLGNPVSPTSRLVKIVFQTKSSGWSFKFFKANCYSFRTIRRSEMKIQKNIWHWPTDLIYEKNWNLSLFNCLTILLRPIWKVCEPILFLELCDLVNFPMS